MPGLSRIIPLVVKVIHEVWLYIVLLIAVLALFYLAFILSNTSVWALVFSGLVFLCLIALFSTARSRQTPIQPEPDVKTTLLTPTVLVNEVRAAALVSYGQIGTVTIKKERSKAEWRALDRLFGEELVMDVGVRVVAGVNLKHLQVDSVRVAGKSVSITLPPTKVLMVYVDESLTRVVSHQNGLFTGRDITLMDAARREAMESMVNATIDKNLLEKAGKQAATTVAAIAHGLGFEDITVTPTMPALGQHFEELQDPSTIAKIIALPPNIQPREDQAGD
jgi:Protein of unknown function (DUF4230)